jgi:hypothetical protein
MMMKPYDLSSEQTLSLIQGASVKPTKDIEFPSFQTSTTV